MVAWLRAFLRQWLQAMRVVFVWFVGIAFWACVNTLLIESGAVWFVVGLFLQVTALIALVGTPSGKGPG